MSPTGRTRRSSTCTAAWPAPAWATPPARRWRSRPPATRESAITATSCWLSAASSASPEPLSLTTRASSSPRRPGGRDQAGDAVTELESATSRYGRGPGQGEQHSRRCQLLAHTELAIARLRSGALDAAITALQPVLTLRPGERTAVQAQRLAALRAELAQPIFRGSAHARELDEQVAEFTRGTLASLPVQDGVDHA